jgi:hypothetical protein
MTCKGSGSLPAVILSGAKDLAHEVRVTLTNKRDLVTNERLTRSSPDSLAATLAAEPSMSLVPLAPFLVSLGMTTCRNLPR